MAIIAFRTDDQLQEKLRRLALEERKTKTEIIREALDSYFVLKNASGRGRVPGNGSLAAAIKDDIGMWNGPEDSSAETGKQLREILGAKHRSRRL